MTDRVHELLTRPRNIRRRIRAIGAEIDGLRLSLLPKAITYDKDRIQASPSDPMTRFAGRLDELERKAQDLQLEYLAASDEVVKACSQLTDGVGAMIIQQRYLSGVSFADIAEMIPASERQMFRYYRQALDELDTIVSVNVSK
jgi:DNA-directed RNA polymerase specialized sigma24 family protein